MSSDVCNDMGTLISAFRARVEKVLADMRSLGWNPLVYETRRTKERAAELHARGTGSADSMHCYDVAVDIVDADRQNVPKLTKEGLWDAPEKFWADLEDSAHRHGLTRLYHAGTSHVDGNARAESWDKPHLQACSIAEQNKLRAMTRDERSTWCTARFPD